MKFKTLHIEKKTYGADKGKLQARVTCELYHTQLEVHIPAEVASDIMKLIAPVLAAQVQMSLLDVQRDHEAVFLAQAIEGETA